MVPNHARYQTSPHPEILCLFIIVIKMPVVKIKSPAVITLDKPEYILEQNCGSSHERCCRDMVYEGRQTNGRRKRRGRFRDKRIKIRGIKSSTKLVICIWVFFLALMVKFVFPNVSSGINETLRIYLEGNVDYEAAVKVLGEGIGGERGFADALSQAFKYAFNIISEDVQVYESVPETDISEKDMADESKPVSAVVVKEPTLSDGTDVEDEVSVEEEVQEEDSTVQHFLESQSEYSHMELPSGVTYDKPELDIQGEVPVDGTVTSHFGYRDHPVEGEILFHYGTDIGAEKGTSVTAFADGTVYAFGDSSSFGLYVILSHGNGVETLYAHLDSISVQDGDTVKRGQEIGKVGDSGNATGPCLHFELTKDGVYLNPEYYVQWQ